MADKKISELPLINTISGSTIIPLVHDGITVRMGVDRFSLFTSQFSATTGSNIFIGNQTINGNLSVSGTSTLIGNTSVGGNLVVNGKLTAQEVHTEVTSASIIFESGSTIFGNSADDTHQFTGSVFINGQNYTTYSSSNSTVFTNFSSSNSTYNTTFSSSNSTTFTNFSSSNAVISQTYSASNSTTFTNFSSSNAVISQVYSASNSTTFTNFSSSNAVISQTYSASNSTTFTNFSSSNAVISQVYSASNSTTFTNFSSSVSQSISSYSSSNSTTFTNLSSSNSTTFTNLSSSNSTTFTNFSSSNAVISQTYSASNSTTFTNYSSSTANSIDNFSIGVGSELSRVYQTTASLNTQTGSQSNLNAQIGIATGSLNAFTGSLRSEVNLIEAYTSSLKNAISVSGTNVQIIGDLNVNKLNVQYISSSVLVTSGSNTFGDQSTDKHEFTGSVYLQNSLFLGNEVLGNVGLNAFTGSQIGKDFTLSVVTSSIDAHILKQATQTGSQDLVNYNISVYTGSQNVINNSVNSHILVQSTQTGSQDLVNYNISVYTGSQNVINTSVNSHILAQSTQTGSQDLVNLGISTFTGSIRSELDLIEAYTASLKGAAIVSSSQQITNYYKFAETASANTFYGTQTINGGLSVNGAAAVTVTSNTAGNTTLNLISTNSANSGKLQFGGATFGATIEKNSLATDSGLVFNSYHGGAEGYTFQSNGTDVMKLTSIGRLGINVSNPTERIHIADTTNGFVGLRLSGSGDYTGTDWTIYASSLTPASADDFLGFFNNSTTDGATSDYKVRMFKNGNVQVVNGNLIMGTSGKGIDFSATSNGAGTTSSELLNDYEEGTWTPTVRGSGTAGTYELATDYTTYTKIGRQVTLNGQIKFGTSVTGGGTGYLQILGAPFTKVENTTGVGAVRLAGINYTGDFISMAFASLGATTTLFLSETVDNSTAIDLPISAAVANAEIQFTITYFV